MSSPEFVFPVSDNQKITEAERNLLIDLYKSYGDIEARNKVIESVYRFIWQFAYKYSKPDNSLEPDDLFQLGILSAIKSIDTFEPDKSKFLTYFSNVYLNDIRMLYRKYIHEDSILSLDAIIFEGKDGSEITVGDTICDDKSAEELYQIEDSDELREFLEIFEDIYKNDLTESQRNCIDQRFGLHGKKCYKTHEEYANEINASRANISRLYNTAIRKIANGFHNRQLTHFNGSNVVTALKSIKAKSIPIIVGLDEKFPKLDDTDSYIVRALYGYKGSTPQRIRVLEYLLGYTKYTIFNRLNYIASDEFTSSDGLERCRSRLDDVLDKLHLLNPIEQKIIKAVYGVGTEQVYSVEDFKTGKPIEGFDNPPRIINTSYIFSKMYLEKKYYDYDSVEKEIMDRYFGMNGYNKHSISDICVSMNLNSAVVKNFLDKSTEMNERVIPKVIKDNAETQFLKEIYPHVDILLQVIIKKMLNENNDSKFTATQIAAKFGISDQVVRAKRRELLLWIKDPELYHKYMEDFNYYKSFAEKIYDNCSDVMKECLDRLFGLHDHPVENDIQLYHWLKDKFGKPSRGIFSLITSQLSKIENFLSYSNSESFKKLLSHDSNKPDNVGAIIRKMYFGLNGSKYHTILEISAELNISSGRIGSSVSYAYQVLNNGDKSTAKVHTPKKSKSKKCTTNKKASRTRNRNAEEIKHILDIYDTLPSKWKIVIDLYYGLHGKEITTIFNISTSLGLSRSGISIIIRRIRNNDIPTKITSYQYTDREALKVKAIEVYDHLSSSWKKLADVYFGLHGEEKVKRLSEITERTGISTGTFYRFINYLKHSDGKLPPNGRRNKNIIFKEDTDNTSTTKEGILLERDIIENRYGALDISDQVVIDCLYGMHGRKKMTLDELCKTFNLGPRKMKKRIQAIFDFILHDYNMNSN